MTKLLLFLIFIFLPIFLIFKLFLKLTKGKTLEQKKSFWRGKLIDKEYLEYEDDDSSYSKDLYTLYFETEEGKKIKINVSQKIYENWVIGDKAEKKENQLLPEKFKLLGKNKKS